MGKTEKTRKENHETKVTKITKTKRRKYGMNETFNDQFHNYLHSKKGTFAHQVITSIKIFAGIFIFVFFTFSQVTTCDN